MKNNEEKIKIRGFRFPEKLWEKLRKSAKKESRTISAEAILRLWKSYSKD